MYCHSCGTPAVEGSRFCKKCGAQLVSTSSVTLPRSVESSQVSNVPEELQGWNWGAAGLTWLWGICNSVWLSLLSWVPVVNIFWWIVLGIHGTEWAWKSGGYRNPEKFKRQQQGWKIAGIVYFCIIPGFFIVGILSSIGLVSLNGAREKARDAAKKSDLATINTAIVLYADDHAGTFPPGPDSATTSVGWSVNGLGVLSGSNYVYAATLPIPGETSAPGTTYWYKISSDKKHYLLSTQLESTGLYYYLNDLGDAREVAVEPSCSLSCP